MQDSREQDYEVSDSLFSQNHNQCAEAEFRNFYGIILQNLCQHFRSKYGDICKALRSIRVQRQSHTEVPPLLSVYEEKDSRYAYIFTFSIIHTIVMYDRFKDMLKINPSMLKKILSVKELKLCILGGGPGFEAVAICKLLSKAKPKCDFHTNSSLKVHITVIDICDEWATVTKSIITSTQKELRSHVDVDFSFIKANLEKKFSPPIIEAIKNADIVTMFKFVGEVFNRHGEEKVQKMINRIIEAMSFESCLFFLDDAGGGLFEGVDKMINCLPCTTKLYNSLHYCHVLSEDIVEKVSFYVKDIFKKLECTSQITVSCSAWLKIRPPPCIEKLIKGLGEQKGKLEKSKAKNEEEIQEENRQLNELTLRNMCAQALEPTDSFRFACNVEETERELSVFYENILKFLYIHLDMKLEDIRQSLRNIRSKTSSYKNPEIEVHGIVDFVEKYDRLAYVFAYCMIHSVVMYDRFSKMMTESPSMLKKIASMKTLSLCVLGGGPGFEAAVVCKLLSNILAQCPDERPPLQVHVTVVDVCAEWEYEMKCIVGSVQKELCSDKNVKVDFSFLKADLTKDFPLSLSKVIKKAHFVSMFKFVSEVNEINGEKETEKMIHNIIESMSYKSCLFFLDNAGGGVFKKVDKMIDALPCTSRIYGPCVHCGHKLSLDVAQEFAASVFRNLKCTTQTTISCSAWMKVRR